MSWVIACVLAATAASSPIVYVDADAATRGVGVYYSTPPTGTKGLQTITTKEK